MLAAPLLAGNDLREMTPGIKEILMNREVIAIDQDKAGKQGTRMRKRVDRRSGCAIWMAARKPWHYSIVARTRPKCR